MIFDSRIVVTAMVALALAGAPTLAEDTKELDGAAIIDKVWQQYRSVGNEREQFDILIVSPTPKEPFTHAEAQRRLQEGRTGVTHKRATRSALYTADHHDKVHIALSLPAEDAGTAFLVWREPDRSQDNQWLYMPALHKVRRIPASSTQTFMGTDFLYEDVRQLFGADAEHFAYERQADESVDGRPCWVIITRPLPSTSTAYSSRKTWIDQEWHLPVRVDHLDKSGTLWKVLRNSHINALRPGVFRADLVEMRDVQIDETSLLLITDRHIGESIPLEVFTRDYLESGGS